MTIAPSSALAAGQAPRLANIFSDHAVLQRGVPVHIWGSAQAGQALTIAINGQSATATADAAGQWSVSFPALAPGGPYTLTVSDGAGAQTTLSDLMVGDVYLCGGQSNMEFPARLSTGAWSEIDTSANPSLRFTTIPHDSETAPLADLKQPAVWKVIGPGTTGEASAVCYYMAKALHKDLNVPIGFIDSDWGGTAIESWISGPALRTQPAYTAGVDLISLLARSPDQAMARQLAAQEDWWDKHDPQAKAQRAFIAPSYDDSAWASLTPAGSWKDSGIAEFKAFDGVAWFRTTVELTADQAAKANKLTLGPIDTYDSTWVNGVWIGSSAMSWVWREYPVAPGVFKAGKNLVVVRVLSGGEGGGLAGSPASRGVVMSDGRVAPINGPWKYQRGAAIKGLKVPPTPWAIPTSLSTLYNGMIAPISGYTVKLAAWYQGETNVGRAKEYQTLLPLLMKDWRGAFDNPDMPFLVAQLSSFGGVATQPGHSDWAELREAQRLGVDADPHAGLIVTFDVGDRTDIHPSQKNVVGQRFARAARRLAYGEPVSPGGPEATQVSRSGADLVVSFRNTQGRLLTYSSKEAIGFEVCTGPDACDYAQALVRGDQIVLPLANSPNVVSVRYAWADAPFANLFSADDQPALPFQLSVSP
jgi:sialate O-acetylesterase